MVFPTLKARRLLAILIRLPLEYEVTRQRGSHRVMESANGYPKLLFSWHDGATDVGLIESEALELI